MKKLLIVVMLLSACMAAKPAVAADVETGSGTIVALSTPVVELVTEEQIAELAEAAGVAPSTVAVSSVTLPYIGEQDVTGFLSKARIGTMFDTKGRNWGLAYVAVDTPLNDWTHDMLALGAGFAYRVNDRQGALVVGPVAQCENILSYASGGRYSMPSVDLMAGASVVYQSGATPEFVGFIGLSYGIKR